MEHAGSYPRTMYRQTPQPLEVAAFMVVDRPYTKKLDLPSLIGGVAMLYWALMFFIVAIIAGLFGFGGIAAGAVGIARILFFVFLVLFIISLVAGGFRRPTA